MDSYTDKQLISRILEIGKEPLLIVGGPGTRKSTLLAERVNSIIQKSLAEPRNIQVLSFNNASVRDLEEKFDDHKVPEAVKISTVHSLAYRIVLQNFAQTGWNGELNITDKMDDELILRDSRYEELGLNEIYMNLADLRSLNEANEYYKFKKFYNGFNFYEITRKAVRLLKSDKKIRNKYLKEIDFLIVDEYQDLNRADQKFIELLTEENHGLTICGDDDQSIYCFRYAFPDGIREKYNSGKFQIVNLEFSYRCPDFIVKVANYIRSKMGDSIPKALKAVASEQKGLIISLPSSTETRNKEAEWVAEKIIEEKNEYLSRKSQDERYKILVLASEEDVYRNLRKILSEKGVDYATKRSKILSQNLARRIYFALKFIEQPNNNLALRWVLHGLTPNTDYNAVITKALEQNLSLWETVNQSEDKKVKTICHNLLSISKENKPSKILEKALEILNIERNNSQGVSKLFEVAEESTTIKEFIGKIETQNLEPEEYTDDSRTRKGFTVELMTIHSAKGLTADVAFIMGLENGIFPKDIQGNYTEEELRLFYVALTRTRRKLYMSFVRSRRGRLARGEYIRTQSKFISIIQELPDWRDYLDFVSC